MRSLHTTLPVLFLLYVVNSNGNLPTYNQQQSFIDAYIPIAIEEMQRSGIPASIKMAQAILESNWGKGATALKGNNYFCIKCNNNWAGDTIRVKDDEPGLSCFRVYGSALESFKDHTNFLLSNSRYSKLFKYDGTDYLNWANGLKECGYATDSLYAQKLINLIEINGLYIYDYAMPISNFEVISSGSMDDEAQNEGHFDSATEGFPSFGRTETPQWDPGFGTRRNEPLLEAPIYSLENKPQTGHETGNQDGTQNQGYSDTPPVFHSARPRSKILPIAPLPDNYLEQED